jgi:hypothetical protein
MTKAKWTAGMAQEVEHLHYKCEFLSSKPNPTKRKRKKKKKRERVYLILLVTELKPS